MDFKLSDEQELIVASYRDYMESENWETYFHECDEKHEYPLRWTKGLCELGFDQVMLPEEHGGLGLEEPLTTLMAIYEVLGQYGAPTYVLYLLTGYNTIVREAHRRANRSLPEVSWYRRAGRQLCAPAGRGSDVSACRPPTSVRTARCTSTAPRLSSPLLWA
ncbi:MAG: acyl-CoA dehydrogenase family protein [Eggerthellaceae bacterium]